VETAFGEAPDVLVCASGVFTLARVSKTTPADFAAALAGNLTAPFLLMRAMIPGMRTAGSGRIVVIGSVADRVILPENGAYSASKFGLRALVEVVRAELRGSGVTASLISPGATDTPLWDPLNPDARKGFTPRSRMLRADQVADAVRWVISRPPSLCVDELRLSSA
jgi:NAD(P)-dependent dehydrogenase (short-subunit alcohol dehydrogenase family)